MREYINTLYRGFKHLYTTSLYPLDPLISPIRTAGNRFRSISEAVFRSVCTKNVLETRFCGVYGTRTHYFLWDYLGLPFVSDAIF